jgi:hypothetical protein
MDEIKSGPCHVNKSTELISHSATDSVHHRLGIHAHLEGLIQRSSSSLVDVVAHVKCERSFPEIAFTASFDCLRVRAFGRTPFAYADSQWALRNRGLSHGAILCLASLNAMRAEKGRGGVRELAVRGSSKICTSTSADDRIVGL